MTTLPASHPKCLLTLGRRGKFGSHLWRKGGLGQTLGRNDPQITLPNTSQWLFGLQKAGSDWRDLLPSVLHLIARGFITMKYKSSKFPERKEGNKSCLEQDREDILEFKDKHQDFPICIGPSIFWVWWSHPPPTSEQLKPLAVALSLLSCAVLSLTWHLNITK